MKWEQSGERCSFDNGIPRDDVRVKHQEAPRVDVEW